MEVRLIISKNEKKISSIKTLETTGNSIFCATETLANWKTLELNPWNIALWQPSVGPCRGIIRGGDIPVLGHDVLLVITLLILINMSMPPTLLFTGNLNLMRNMNTQAKTFIMVNKVIFRWLHWTYSYHSVWGIHNYGIFFVEICFPFVLPKIDINLKRITPIVKVK